MAAPSLPSLRELRRMSAELEVRADALEGAIAQLKHDYNSLRAALMYLHDVLDRMEGKTK